MSSQSILLRDDRGPRSLSSNEVEFILRTSEKIRQDGRGPLESRPVRFEFRRSAQGGSSSCQVEIGPETAVVAEIHADLTSPLYLDRPNDGILSVSVEVSSAASLGSVRHDELYHNVPENQRNFLQRTQRLLETALSGSMDTEALCVRSGVAVWRLSVRITVLSDGGNSTDACMLAASGAMRHFRLPCVDGDGDDAIVLRDGIGGGEPSPLPLHHTTVSSSMARLSSSMSSSKTSKTSGKTTFLLVDPTDREEWVADCPSLTHVFNGHGLLVAADYPGGSSSEIGREELLACATLSRDLCQKLTQSLEKALEHAEDVAQKDMEERHRVALAHVSTQPVSGLQEQLANMDRVIDLQTEAQKKEEEKRQQREREEEEAYRLRALDYDLHYVAASVRAPPILPNEINGSLMEAMLRSSKPPPLRPPPCGEEPPSSAFRSKDDEDEFESFAQKVENNGSNGENNDEEEDVVVYNGEFSSLQKNI